MCAFLEDVRKFRNNTSSCGCADIDAMISYMEDFRVYLKHPKLFEKIVKKEAEK